MSKKRKKRRPRRPLQTASSPASPPEKPAAAKRRAAASDERPPAPWGSFPLVEIAVLVGLAMLIVGFIMGGERGFLLIFIGIGLAGLAGLELSIREHFAGFRSHSSMLAGIPAIAVLGVLFYAGPDSLPALARVGIAAVVFAAAFYGFATMFRRKAGVAVKLR